MKKVLVSMAALLMATSLYAQDDKAAAKAAEKAAKEAAKAAKEADKAATKAAYALYDEGVKCFNESNAKMGEFNQFRQMEKDEAKIQARQKELNAFMLEKAKKGAPLLSEALATGRIEEKNFFEAYRAQDFMVSQLINVELQHASQNEPFDTVNFSKYATEMCDACHYQLKYGKKSDDTQKMVMAQAEAKFPRLYDYLAYATQFEIQNKNVDGAIAAFENYKNFGKKYPEVANSEKVKNPSVPFAQFAFNIYYIAYQAKRYDVCAKFYDDALQFNDNDSKLFVTQSRPQMYLAQGDTTAWANCLKEMIDADPSSSSAEVAAQNLLAHYSKQGVSKMNSFADDLLAKNPNSKIANYGKGYALIAQQKYEEAAKYYEKCVEVDPEYVDGLYQCGFCYYQIGLENGRKIADKKYKSQAEADKDAESKVKVHLRKALPYFEKVRELVPDNTDRWAYELKTIYNNLGQKAKAKELTDQGL